MVNPRFNFTGENDVREADAFVVRVVEHEGLNIVADIITQPGLKSSTGKEEEAIASSADVAARLGALQILCCQYLSDGGRVPPTVGLGRPGVGLWAGWGGFKGAL
jgi:hypothetical protein